MALSEFKIKHLKPKEKRYFVCDGRGLYIAVMPSGEKYWYCRVWENGKDRKTSLGRYPDIGLKQAREMRHTVGPRPKEGPAVFAEAAEEWFTVRHAPAVDTRTAAITRSRLDHAILPELGWRDMRGITPRDVLEVVRPLYAKTPHSGRRVKSIIFHVFQYAMAAGRVEWNPAAQIAGALPPAPAPEHRSSVRTEDSARRLLADVRGYAGNPLARLYLLLLAYTFTRPSELRLASWGEISGDTWTIPAPRMKTRTEHIVPLSTQARALFAEVRSISNHTEYCFARPTRDVPFAANLAGTTLIRLGYGHGKATPHSFRGMASTLLNEHGWPPDVIERQLAHAQRDRVRAAYNRAEYLPERRRMMQWWGDWLDRL